MQTDRGETGTPPKIQALLHFHPGTYKLERTNDERPLAFFGWRLSSLSVRKHGDGEWAEVEEDYPGDPFKARWDYPDLYLQSFVTWNERVVLRMVDRTSDPMSVRTYVSGDEAELEANLAGLWEDHSLHQAHRRRLVEATRARIIAAWPWALPAQVELVP